MAIFCCFGYDVSNPEEERNVSVGSPVLPEYRNDASSSSSATSSVAGEEPVNVEKEEADEINLKHVLEFSTTSSKFKHEIKVVEEVEEEDQSQSTGTGTGVFGLFGSQSSVEPSKSTKKAVGSKSAKISAPISDDVIASYVGGRDSEGYFDGEGRIVYLDGGVYLGYCVKGMRHHAGKMMYPDKTYYVGEWAYDKRNGMGVYRDAKGKKIYKGNWVDGKMDNEK